MLQQIYSALPIPLQHACATAQGARYHRWRYGGIFQEYLSALKRTEYLPADELCELQTAGLKRLLQFACTHVPYYRKHGAVVHTTKDQIRERPEDFIADTFPRRSLIPWHTSGTTGKPLTIYYSRQAMRKMWAFVELCRNTAGVTKSDRRGQFTGKMIVPPAPGGIEEDLLASRPGQPRAIAVDRPPPAGQLAVLCSGSGPLPSGVSLRLSVVDVRAGGILPAVGPPRAAAQSRSPFR